MKSNVPQYPITDFDFQRMPRWICSAIRSRATPIRACGWAWWAPVGGTPRGCACPIVPELDYVPRFGWVDRHTVWVETLSRDHKQRDIYFVDASNSQSRLVLEITDDKFLDENYDVDVEARQHRPDRLEGWPQPDLSLSLRRAQSACRRPPRTTR